MEMGGSNAVNEFYRLFLAPGVDHCGGGNGPVPIDPMQALVDWVEKNEPPDRLDASTRDQNGELITRELCLWPKLPYYNGEGDPTLASSFHCA